MSIKKPQTKLVLGTHRSPGKEAGSKTPGEVVRQVTPDDLNTLNVKHYDQMKAGCPRPFRPVFKFAGKDVFGGHKVPKPVTGR